MYKKNPDSLLIGGREYRINTDFRVWMQINLRSAGKTEQETAKVVHDFIISQGLPNTEESFRAVLDFYSCGKKEENVENGKERAFDFEKDEDLIFAAFLSQYHVNLRTDFLHWWDFMAMFAGLAEEHVIVKIMGIRTMDTSKMPKEQKAHYDKLKARYSLGAKSRGKRYSSIEERNAAWIAEVQNMNKLKEIAKGVR